MIWNVAVMFVGGMKNAQKKDIKQARLFLTRHKG